MLFFLNFVNLWRIKFDAFCILSDLIESGEQKYLLHYLAFCNEHVVQMVSM